MIADTAKIALTDGTTKLAIDLQPGGEVMTVKNQKLGATLVVDKIIENHDDIVCLVLANGQKLIGSRDQRIAVNRNKRTWYVEMADIDIGMELVGKLSGMPVLVRVVGVMRYAKRQIRLVGLQIARNQCFIAEGILCRS